MGLQEYLILREKLATWLFEHLPGVPDYVVARREADRLMERLHGKPE